ncbi:unnamed protein product [Clavelina lepadiformis]|uniref:Alcohol dehydrogenase n=1 Tax=Clavelina lepadiformis TaxID=159417 RepID=A0ABP0F877_CLALP
MNGTEVSRLVYFGSQHKPQWLTDHSNKLPEIACGEVLVKVRLATICASDLRTISGKRSECLPSILGHEAVCEIIEDKRVPEEEHRTVPLENGTRVTFSATVACSECSTCRLGCPQKCKHLFKYGHAAITTGNGFSGCYATHMILKRSTLIIPLPPEISDRVVAPANCALATMVNAVEQARTPATNRVVVVQGAGMLGLYACALLRHKGYERVLCCDNIQGRLAMVERFGGEPCQDLAMEPSAFADCVIEACGNPNVLREGMSAIRYEGVYVWVGMIHPDSQLSITGEEVIRKCVTIKGVHNYHPRHLEEAVEFLKETFNQYPYEDLLSQRSYNLKEFEDAICVANSKTFHRVCISP